MAAGDRLRLSRAQLASFLPDPQAIKQFEKLIEVVDDISPNVTEEVAALAAFAVAKANEVSALAELLQEVLETLETAPKPIPPDDPEEDSGPRVNHGDLVHITGTETVEGDKTFTGLVNLDEARFVAGVTPANTLGTVAWGDTSQTLETNLDPTNTVTLHHGQDVLVRCINKTGVQIDSKKIVHIDGADTSTPTCVLARANDIATCKTVGVALHNIGVDQTGVVKLVGLVDFDTSGFVAGDTVYVSTATAGLLTNSAPVSPDYMVRFGKALNSNVSGKIWVKPEYPVALDTAMTAATNLAAPSQGAVFTYAASAASAAVAAHAALQTGIHGISITAGKTFSCSNTLTLAGTDGSTLNIGTGGTLGTAAYVADSSLVHIAGTETVTGAKTFSAVATFSNTTVCTGPTVGSLLGVNAGLNSTNTETSGSNHGLYSKITPNPGSASSGNYFGVRGHSDTSASCAQNITGAVTGGYFQGSHVGTGTATSLRGITAISSHTSSGISTNMYGVDSSCSNTGSGATQSLMVPLRSASTVNNASLTLTTLQGVRVDHTLTAGTVTTLTGVAVSAITATSLTATTTVIGYDVGAINAASSTPATNAYAMRTGNVTGASTGNWQLHLGTGISKWNDTTEASAVGTASAVFVGGIGVAKKIYAGSVINQAAVAAGTTEGDTFFETTQNHHGSYSGGMKGWYDRTVCSNYANRTQSGIVTAQSIVPTSMVGTTTIPANWFKQGKRLRYIIRGVYTTDAVPGNGTLAIKLGATTFRTTGSFALDNSVTAGYWRLEGAVTCFSTGAAGTVGGIMCWEHEQSGGVGQPLHTQTGTTITAVTLDTTASQVFDVVWTATDAGTSITCTDFLLIERA
jgi:hypothetical protein